MIKRITCTILCFAAVNFLFAQQSNIDSLLHELHLTQNDTIKLVRMRTISMLYGEIDPDSSYYYAEKTLGLARQLQLKMDEASALREMGYALMNGGNFPRSLQILLSALAILEDPKIEQWVLVGKFPGDDELFYRDAMPSAQRLSEIAYAHQVLAVLYANSNNYQRSWHHHLLGREAANQSGNTIMQSILNLTLNRIYLNLNKPDSALLAIEDSYNQAMRSGYKRYLGSVLLNLGRTHAFMGNATLANDYYRKSLVISEAQGYNRGVVASSLLLGNFYNASRNIDSAFFYINNALVVAQDMDAPELLLRSYIALTQHYRTIGNNDSVAKYQSFIININDSLFTVKQAQQFQNIDFDELLRKQQIEAAEKVYKNRITQYSLIAGLSVFLLIVIILFRNNKQKLKVNKVLESTLSNLKSTQAQLIQSEKMASLGELTAGIAHEIQNPLNFVNNFSEVSAELVEEIKEARNKSQETRPRIAEDEFEDEILEDIKQNLEKITLHGKRADAIVKGMLEHSRANKGEKSLTDLNALADEYLRLSYHGLRAKDKSFNAAFTTDFDPNLPKINLIPQDIGRVLLNVINNAFQATNEPSKGSKPLEGYNPLVTVSTSLLEEGRGVQICVQDNGSGIPDSIKDKIFQPFFTTKPTGSGTGLGLSLSYDIVKAHGGELKLETEEGKGSKFKVFLPL